MSTMNGLAIIECSEAGTTAAMIEQETLEFYRQNARAKKHRAEVARKERHEKAAAARKEMQAEVDRLKAMEAEAQCKAYNKATVKTLLICIAVAAFAVCGCAFDLIHPGLALPIALASLLIGSERLGEWRGKHRNKEGR